MIFVLLRRDLRLIPMNRNAFPGTDKHPDEIGICVNQIFYTDVNIKSIK